MFMDLSRLLVNEVRSVLDMLERGECGFTPEETERAFRTVQYYKHGISHFDEMTARACIAQMYCFVDESHKVFAPFVDYDRAEELYSEIALDIPDYNFWDFAVTLNLAYSNHAELFKGWTKGKDKLERRLAQLSVSFLNEENALHPEGKIWWYMNG